MSKLISKQFWTKAAERAVKTVAQVVGLASVLTSVASIDAEGQTKRTK